MPTAKDIRIDEIGKIILDHRYEKDPRDMNALKYSSYLIAKKVLEYLAPELEKARKWDKVKEIADYTDKTSCIGCPIEKLIACGEVCEYMGDVVNALDEKEAERG